MNLSEALTTGGMVTVTGVVIVFLVLIILMLVMMAMKKIFYKEPAKNEAPSGTKQAEQPKKAPVVSAPTEDLTLIAVLTAAVAASMDAPASKIRIKSFRRVGGSAPAWNRAGLRDVIDSRF